MSKKPWEIWDSKFDMVKDKTKNWCFHVGGRIVKDDPKILEGKLPLFNIS